MNCPHGFPGFEFGYIGFGVILPLSVIGTGSPNTCWACIEHVQAAMSVISSRAHSASTDPSAAGASLGPDNTWVIGA